MQELIIKDIIKSEFASDNEQGDLIFKEIEGRINQNQNVEIFLDFIGLRLITTAFLNNAIAKLYKNFSSETIRKILKIKNIKDKDDLELLKLVILNAIESTMN